LKYLAPIEFWAVTALVGASFITSRALPWAVILAALFVFLRLVIERRLVTSTPADWAIGLLLVMVPVTLLVTTRINETLVQVYRLLSGVALYYAIVHFADSRFRLRQLMGGWILAGLILAAFAFIGVDWVQNTKLNFIPSYIYAIFPTRVSDTANPNVLAGSLVLLLPGMLALLIFDWKGLARLERLFLCTIAILVAGVLVLTQSRGGIQAAIAAILILLLLRWRRGWIIIGSVGILALITMSVFGFNRVLEALVASSTLGGLAGRLEVWSRALYLIADFPFTGVGMGSFTQAVDLFYPLFTYEPGSMPHAHNLFLQIAVDLGIPGLIAWLGVWMAVIYTAWRVYRNARKADDGWITGLGAGVIASQVALIVHGLLDAVTWGMVRPAPMVWAIWGIAMATSRMTLFNTQNTSER
jgi:putative inorganic carbon (HCO3(-)) transporter